MRNRLDEDYFLTMGKFAVIIAGTAIAGAVVWSLPWKGIAWSLALYGALIAEQTGIKF